MKLLLENWNKFLREQEINEATEQEIEYLNDALEVPFIWEFKELICTFIPSIFWYTSTIWLISPCVDSSSFSNGSKPASHSSTLSSFSSITLALKSSSIDWLQVGQSSWVSKNCISFLRVLTLSFIFFFCNILLRCIVYICL